VATQTEHYKQRKPPWLKIKLPTHDSFFQVASLIKGKHLHTICESARCPNITECWSKKTATFMILGSVCSRDCAFCAVPHGTPHPLNADEAIHVAESVDVMDLRYAVITSVTRDDLADGGASQFVAVIQAIRKKRPQTRIELLVPDFKGDEKALLSVIQAGPDVLNHNLEVPERLYPIINRPPENYCRSLELINRAGRQGVITKSGLMVGLGENEDDLIRTLKDLRGSGCDLLTIGQYLQATEKNSSVVKYYDPDEFSRLKTKALELGFSAVVAGPLVRSSYRAHRLYRKMQDIQQRTS